MILGLTGREPVVEVKVNTFCRLCSRILRVGDDAVAARGGKSIEYFIHQDCAVAELTGQIHVVEYREEVKRPGSSRRARRKKKMIRQSEGTTVCYFCRKRIVQGDTFVLEEDKPYHNSGRNSCLVRFRRVINMSRSSLYG